MREHLWVRVNRELTLDAGSWEQVWSEDAPYRLLYPPSIPLFDQVIAYLKSRSEQEGPSIRMVDQARAAVAVCLRWGTYLAVVLDPEKPAMQEAGLPNVSRLTNDEMKRINIESSYALSQWIQLMNTDYWGRYQRLLGAAQRLLPLPSKSAKRSAECLAVAALASPKLAAKVLDERLSSPYRQKAERETNAAPYRVLANALINAVWRNGPIEDIHGGRSSNYPICQRRATDRETRLLMRTASERMINALYGVHAIIDEHSERSLVEKVLPYRLVPDLLITPTGWTIQEVTSEVRLAGPEPK